MIKKLRKKFVITSILSVFVLLTTILLVINLVNFSLVTSDADKILDRMVSQGGAFQDAGMPNGTQSSEQPSGQPAEQAPNGENGSAFGRRDIGGNFDPNGPKGPNSPELSQTTRFFTVSFDESGNVVNAMVKVNVVSEEAAIDWARSLSDKSGGWTNTYYRYRVWKNGNTTSVTVIDQSRELLPSFRVLIASCVGEALGLVVSLIILIYVSKIVSDPVEKSDRKQKRFIEDAAYELKNPITSIDALRLSIEEKQGESQETQMIARETKRMAKVVQGLDTLLLIENSQEQVKKEIDLSALFNEIALGGREEAEKRGKSFVLNTQSGVSIKGDENALERLISISLKNAVDYSESKIEATLKREDERVVMEFTNDTKGLEDGPLDSVFERFWRSPEVKESGLDGAGLGLSVAKEIVSLHGGRIRAEIKNGDFILKVEL